jgi:phosphatidate cytidylyltransferase
VLVGAILIPVVLVINHVGGLTYALFVSLLAGLGSYEFYSMVSRPGHRPFTAIGILGSVFVCISFHFGSLAAAWCLTIFAVAVLITGIIRGERENYVIGTAITLSGMVYTGWLLGYFILLRECTWETGGIGAAGSANMGRSFVYLVLILTWSYDSVAYVVGTFVGRHRLMPQISPSKTVEGTVAGLAGCVVAAAVCRFTFASYLGMIQAVTVGLFLGAMAQSGDLVESMIKRSTGRKDSSHLIPGHGGLLDRFDSLLLTGPSFYLYLRMVLWTTNQ